MSVSALVECGQPRHQRKPKTAKRPHLGAPPASDPFFHFGEIDVAERRSLLEQEAGVCGQGGGVKCKWSLAMCGVRSKWMRYSRMLGHKMSSTN